MAVAKASDRSCLELQRSESPQGPNTVDISGGNFQTANIGPQTHNLKCVKNEKTIHHDYTNAQIGTVNITNITQGPSSTHETSSSEDNHSQAHPEWIELKGMVRMFHGKKLGGCHNIFHGEQHSDVTGIKPLAIKSLPFCERHIREANMLKDLKHPNVVGVVHADSYFLGPMKHMYIAMERCSEQNLYDYLLEKKNLNIAFDCKKFVHHAKQLTEGLMYIHANKIVHRDIKPHNVLLSLCEKVLKINDFGLCTEMTSGRFVTSTSLSRPGTDGYRAPETYNSNEISQQADIFSLGLVLYFLWSYGLHPFGGDPDEWNMNIKRYENCDVSGLLVDDFKNAESLLKWMLHFHPRQRPTAEEVLHHAVFSERQRSGIPHPSSFPQLASVLRSSSPSVAHQGASAHLQACNGLHASESEPMFILDEAAPPEQPTFDRFSLDDLEFIDATPQEFKETPEEPKARAQSDTQTITLPPPPLNTRKRRTQTGSPAQERRLRERQEALDARSSPSTPGYFGEGSAIRRKPQRATAGERPKPTLLSPEHFQRPRSLPDEMDAWSLALMTPEVLHDGASTNNNALLVFDKPSKALQLFNPQMKLWEKIQHFCDEFSKMGFTTVTLGGYVYVFTAEGRVLRFKYSDKNTPWEELPNMGKPHGDHPPVVALNGEIYLVGGASLQPVDEVEKFSPSSGQWSDVGVMLNSRSHHAVVAAKGCIYCIGGQKQTMLQSVDKFDTFQRKWSSVSPMKHSRNRPGAAAHDGKIYVMGGYRPSHFGDSKLSSAEIYDIDTDSWTSLHSSMRKPRAEFVACVINGQIYAVGGDKKGFHDEKKTIEWYDVTTGKWTLIDVPKHIRMDSMTSVAINCPDILSPSAEQGFSK